MQNTLRSNSSGNILMNEKAIRIATFEGIEIYRISTGKFKTNSINFFFLDNLTQENVTKNALIPAVLRRGCRQFPTFREIAERFEELYGASFDCGVSKKGECQIIQFYTEFLSDSYSLDGSDLFKSAFNLLCGILFEPVLENNAFREDYLLQEKDNLKKLIEGRINDKMQYSVERCFEEMCKNEPFGLYEYGYTSDLQNINASDLYSKYTDMLENYPMQVYISGDADDDKIQSVIDALKKMKRNKTGKRGVSSLKTGAGNVKNITENMDVTQGKLTLGFRTNTAPDNKDYYSLVLCNGILGGGIHSKLFQNVREKASLAYYAYSRLEKFKGLMIVSSGIDLKNKEKAQKIILEQLEEIKKGNISDYEYEATVKSMETGLKSMMDSQMQIVDFYLSQSIAGTEDSFGTLLEKFLKVTVQDIIEVSKKIELDTIYFLTKGDADENK